MRPDIRTVFILSALFLLANASPAHAYLDPGTGSYVLQVLLAALVAGLYGIKQYWYKIKGFFGGKSGLDRDE